MTKEGVGPRRAPLDSAETHLIMGSDIMSTTVLLGIPMRRMIIIPLSDQFRLVVSAQIHSFADDSLIECCRQ